MYINLDPGRYRVTNPDMALCNSLTNMTPWYRWHHRPPLSVWPLLWSGPQSSNKPQALAQILGLCVTSSGNLGDRPHLQLSHSLRHGTRLSLVDILVPGGNPTTQSRMVMATSWPLDINKVTSYDPDP